MIRPDPLEHGWWLASRASGIVALALITLSVMVGLTMSGKLMQQRPGLARTLLAFHEHAAVVGLVAIAVHGVTLLGDAWLRPGLSGIAVPFAMDYRPAYTGLGIVAGYMTAALGLSYYLRARIGPKTWRKLHTLTLLAYAMSVVHVLGAGTDAAEPWLRLPIAGTATAVLLMFGFRIEQVVRRRLGSRGAHASSSPRGVRAAARSAGG